MVVHNVYSQNSSVSSPVPVNISGKSNSSESQPVYYNIQKSNKIEAISQPGYYKIKKSNFQDETITVDSSDIDLYIPTNKEKCSNCYAVIIGNEDYSSFQTNLSSEQNVPFAINDATIFREYCIKTLGVLPENVIFETNIGLVKFKQVLNQINSIISLTKGNAKIIFYYSGHGYPNELTKEPFLIPVDVPGSNTEMAISIKEVYKKLAEFPSRQVVVFLDACFSGAGRMSGLVESRGVKIKPIETAISGNLIAFTACQEDQSALGYKEKKHGIFTYFLLKKLQETKGEIKLSDLEEYVTTEIPIKSVLINTTKQDPKVLHSPEISDTWKNWKLY